jgi:hypothetical protein
MSATETDEQTETRIAETMAETPDDTDDTGEPEPEPEPEDGEEPESEAVAARADRTGDIEKTHRALEKEAERHARRVEELMGSDFAALQSCELCWEAAPGFRWGRMPDPETVAHVRVVIGMPDLSNFAPSSTERQCDDCRGRGKVRTGSCVSKYETAICDACKGKGWVVTRQRLNEIPDAHPDDAPAQGATVSDDDGVTRDMFGTPETDPDYGKMPNMRARPTDYWLTARE